MIVLDSDPFQETWRRRVQFTILREQFWNRFLQGSPYNSVVFLRFPMEHCDYVGRVFPVIKIKNKSYPAMIL